MNNTAVTWATAAERRSAAHTTMSSGVSSYAFCFILTLYKLLREKLNASSLAFTCDMRPDAANQMQPICYTNM